MKKLIKDTINSRQRYNRIIVEELSKIVEENPSLRFGQILSSNVLPSKMEYIHFTDLDTYIYNEESIKTLSRMGDA